MNHRRFHFGSDDIGARMLREADSIEVKLYKINGAVQATFELHGCLADENGDDELGCPTSPEGLRLVRQMLDAFEEVNDGQGRLFCEASSDPGRGRAGGTGTRLVSFVVFWPGQVKTEAYPPSIRAGP